MDLEIWHQFGQACSARQTTRGVQVTEFIAARMREWKQQEAAAQNAHHGAVDHMQESP